MPTSSFARGLPRPALASLDLPQVWRVTDLAREERCVPTGHAALDAVLPGGGWPVGVLIEVLQAQATQHVWSLLLPALQHVLHSQPGPLVLVDPPMVPFGPGLRARGLPLERLLWVQAKSAPPGPAARGAKAGRHGAGGLLGGQGGAWAAEQALRCADVAVVVAWLPQARDEALRRLHGLAAQQQRLLFVMRGLAARAEASPARVRVQVGGADSMQLQVLKRRGPPLSDPLVLPAQPTRLSALLQARRRLAGLQGAPGHAAPAVHPGRLGSPAQAGHSVPATESEHVVGRAVSLAS